MNSFIILYHGAIAKGRGIETIIALLSYNPNISCIVLGSGSDNYLHELNKLVRTLHVEKRFCFINAVPLEELWQYIGAADLSVIFVEGSAKSYFLSLPNKFFESIQSLTPIVASDFPEIKRLIDKYEIGLTCDPSDLEAINNCVERMRTDVAFYKRCKRNLKLAKEELCWENEKLVLINAFRQKVMGASI